MSPQLAPSEGNGNECSQRFGLSQHDVTATAGATGVAIAASSICMSNSQIAQAADEAFSHHMRLDLDRVNFPCDSGDIANPLEMGTPKSRNRLNLKKRKKLFESNTVGSHEDAANAQPGIDNSYFPQTQQPTQPRTLSKFDTDFVSGLFRDLSEVTTSEDPSMDTSDDKQDLNQCDNQYQPHETNCITDDEFSRSRASKRLKSSGKLTLSRSRKSFTRLPNLDLLSTAAVSKDSHDDVHYQMCQRRVSIDKHDRSINKQSTFSSHSGSTSASSTVTLNTDLINSLVDKVLIDTLPFPCIPPTVSESSCSSNNLTQTSVRASQVLENPINNDNTHIEGGLKHAQKDTYGWFVDTDLQEDTDRADVINAAKESCLGQSMEDNLSYKAFTAPKKTSDHDQEVEWAKAADTVDDVLGDFF